MPGKSLRKLGNIVSRLPDMGSHLGEARRNDPDVVAAALAVTGGESGQQVAWRPRGEDVTLEVELLMRLSDRFDELIAVQVSHPLPKGAKPQKPGRPFPRPVREIDRARARADEEYMDSLDDDVAAAQARWVAAHADTEPDIGEAADHGDPTP